MSAIWPDAATRMHDSKTKLNSNTQSLMIQNVDENQTQPEQEGTPFQRRPHRMVAAMCMRAISGLRLALIARRTRALVDEVRQV